MKRLSFVLALVAVLALAGTAAAGPNLTISGSASITVSGSTDDLTPSVGGLSLGLKNGFDITGDRWTLGGDLYVSGSWFDVRNWKLTINPGIFQFRFANGANYTRAVLTSYGDYLGFTSISGIPSGNHMQVVAPLAGLTLVYDKADSQEALYVEIPKGDIPFGFKGVYDAVSRKAAGTIHYDFGTSNFWTEAGAVVAQNTGSVGYGAEVNIPVTNALTAYLVAKQFQAGYPSVGGNTYTLGEFNYVQPQYKLRLYIWSRIDSASGSVAERNHFAQVYVQPQGQLGWYTDSSTAYRSLKGLGFYANYDIDSPSLLLAAGAPVLGNKGALKVWVDNALGATPKVSGELYVKLSDKLTSATSTSYTKGTGLGAITDTLTYSVSGSSSLSVTLTKPNDANRVGYTATFTVNY